MCSFFFPFLFLKETLASKIVATVTFFLTGYASPGNTNYKR